MVWPFHHKPLANYWIKAFALYALVEACIQLLFWYILNTFGNAPISNIEFHIVMWAFQCALIWPIWWVARSVLHKPIVVQVLVNTAFYFIYTYIWFGPVQELIAYLHQHLQSVTRPPSQRLPSVTDRASDIAYLNYQVLKHGFRLSWFYLANYFYHFRLEEKKRLELAVANKELQLKLLKWHLNPAFYFKTIDHLRELASQKPVLCTAPILQLAKVMEYVIYEAKERTIDVKKEIHFLHNYIQLVNQQPGNHAAFELQVSGEYDKLRIAPLLLAGFIDNISGAVNNKQQQHYRLQLQFDGKEMECRIDGEQGHGTTDFFSGDTTLCRRLQELYPGKFHYAATDRDPAFSFNLQLDEER
jgi:hypothetical protein